METEPRDRRVLLRAAFVIADYARQIRESEVSFSGPGRGKIDDPEIRSELAEYRNVVNELIRLGGGLPGITA